MIQWRLQCLLHNKNTHLKWGLVTFDQLNFCRQNQDIIVKKAEKLYRMIRKKNVSGPLKRRCLNWDKLEEIMERFGQ